ncbi:uncharacterized protein PgNI_02996, partial [Pyricularia grisea]|uniref:Uncharacterized protein n=1 Tax=Pyricularia grisea TaxID=148305 RepID=A0A6P8BBV4_PYRGI
KRSDPIPVQRKALNLCYSIIPVLVQKLCVACWMQRVPKSTVSQLSKHDAIHIKAQATLSFLAAANSTLLPTDKRHLHSAEPNTFLTAAEARTSQDPYIPPHSRYSTTCYPDPELRSWVSLACSTGQVTEYYVGEGSFCLRIRIPFRLDPAFPHLGCCIGVEQTRGLSVSQFAAILVMAKLRNHPIIYVERSPLDPPPKITSRSAHAALPLLGMLGDKNCFEIFM